MYLLMLNARPWQPGAKRTQYRTRKIHAWHVSGDRLCDADFGELLVITTVQNGHTASHRFCAWKTGRDDGRWTHNDL
jgi:hypothetical protein